MSTDGVSLSQDLSRAFAEYVESTSFSTLPANVVETAKRSLLDTIAVTLGASGLTPGVKALVELVREAGGKEESTIIAFGGKVPAWMAAFANGAMSHGLDFDDVHDAAALHASSATVPAALAVAERLGGASGRDVITAVAIGNDLAYRIALSVDWVKSGWHATPVIETFGAAAVAAKLLGLRAEGIVDALGIAFCQAAGTMELAYGVGSDLRGMYPAFPAKAGVLSALLAAKGVAGIKSTFEGKAGFFRVYFQNEFNRDAMTTGLGSRFESGNTSFKAWPACREVHFFIEATLRLMKDHDIRAENIAEIATYEGKLAHGCAEPLDGRRQPKTTLDAKFSIPFAVAVAATKGAVRIGDFTEQGIRDARVLEMAQKVKPNLHPPFEEYRGLTPGRVDIKTSDGRVYSMTLERAYGNPANPISERDLLEKFWDCAAYAVRPLPKDNLQQVVDLVGSLERVDDVSEVVRLLA